MVKYGYIDMVKYGEIWLDMVRYGYIDMVKYGEIL